jgi:hypothetical protein
MQREMLSMREKHLSLATQLEQRYQAMQEETRRQYSVLIEVSKHTLGAIIICLMMPKTPHFATIRTVSAHVFMEPFSIIIFPSLMGASGNQAKSERQGVKQQAFGETARTRSTTTGIEP